ncbi:hypothetical protein [Vibrio parahaemolyticus]|uniref:hypothetical protein n=1 Tax=Vibrio parahaemolyticus TaxID=670 RepID=UPI00338DFFEF
MDKSFSEIILRSSVGIVPYVGPFLNELISTFIPDQRSERIEHYQSLLAQKLSALSEDYLNQLGKRPIHLSLLERGYKEAIDAATETRREFIANLVSSGVEKEKIDLELTSHLFRILKEVTDNEVILLRYFASRYESEDREFKEKFRDIVEPIHVLALDPDPDKIRRSALRESSVSTLRRLNLIDSTLVSPKSSGSFISTRDDAITYKSSNVTHLGSLFLEYLEMLPDKSS